MEVMKENAFLSQEYARLKDIMNMSTEQDYKILTIAEYLLLIWGLVENPKLFRMKLWL